MFGGEVGVVSELAQRGRGDLGDGEAVVEDQNALAASARRLARWACRRRDAVASQRKQDGEHGAAAGRRIDGDAALVAAHDAVDHREPEAGALARILGGEERIEDPAENRRLDAVPGVGDGKGQVAAGGQRAVDRGARSVENRLAQPDPDLALLPERLSRVEDQVGQHLVDLVRIAQDRTHASIDVGVELEFEL